MRPRSRATRWSGPAAGGLAPTRRVAVAAVALTLVLLVAGCGSPPASTTPPGSSGAPSTAFAGSGGGGDGAALASPTGSSGKAGVPGGAGPSGSAPPSKASGSPGWTTASVDQPSDISAQPSDAPAFCSPCHPALGTYVSALVHGPAGYYALGYSSPPAAAAAWLSSDATTWRRIASFPAPQSSLIMAAVVSGSTIVAVGESGRSAAVWRLTAGAGWTVSTLPASAGGYSDRMTAVARAGSGFVAAGYVEDRVATRTAAFWRSPDGVVWRRVGVSAGPPTEVTALAAAGSTAVAVGIAGDERRGAAAAWLSTDGGASWRAVTGSALDAGRMLAVAAGLHGFVAVGEKRDQTGAAAWRSDDGSVWQPAPAQQALENGGQEMVMTAVAADAGGFVAVGWRTDAGNGSAVAWHSTNGLTWADLPDDPSFSGGGMAAVLAGPPLVAGGTIGWPDTHALAVWLRPT